MYKYNTIQCMYEFSNLRVSASREEGLPSKVHSASSEDKAECNSTIDQKNNRNNSPLKLEKLRRHPLTPSTRPLLHPRSLSRLGTGIHACGSVLFFSLELQNPESQVLTLKLTLMVPDF